MRVSVVVNYYYDYYFVRFERDPGEWCERLSMGLAGSTGVYLLDQCSLLPYPARTRTRTRTRLYSLCLSVYGHPSHILPLRRCSPRSSLL